MALLNVFLVLAVVGCTGARALRDSQSKLERPVPRDRRPKVPEKDRRIKLDGAWQYEKTQWLAQEQLGRCIDPEPTSENSTTWISDLQAAAEAVPRPLKAWSQSYSRNLQMFGATLGTMIPKHRAIGLTSDRNKGLGLNMDVPSSKCHEFNYEAAPGTIPDPDGCGLFRKSFSRLQKLRTCIVESLQGEDGWEQDSNKWPGSAVWRRYREAVDTIKLGRTPGHRDTDSPHRLTDDDLGAVTDEFFLEDFRECVKKGKCVILDANLRADEMIKYLSFKDWNWKRDDLKKWVAGKVRYTASVYKTEQESWLKPDKISKKLGLEDQVVDRIVSTCFQVSADSYTDDSPPPREAATLERSLVCNALMFDTVEVPGKPEPPPVNGADMWDDSLVHKGRDLPEGTLKNTPPVCARAALALALWPQIHAPRGYSAAWCLIDKKMRWSDCSSLDNFNCICLEKCWRTAMKRVCELTPGEPLEEPTKQLEESNGLRGCCGDLDKIS